MSKLILE